MLEHMQRMARYNQWVNRKIYAKVTELSDEDIAKDRGAFFSSILGTFNHILVADMFWLNRMASSPTCKEALAPMLEKPKPTGLGDIFCMTISNR